MSDRRSSSSTPLRIAAAVRDDSEPVKTAWERLKPAVEETEGLRLVAAAVGTELQVDPDEIDLVLVLGGDGAILRACRRLGEKQRPILGVNLGRLGFLAELSPEEFLDNLPRIAARQFTVVDHLMFECRLRRADGTEERHLGLNEVALSAATPLQMLDVCLAVDEEPVATFSGDGLIVSTPVGSTAHSLSAGGPILRHSLQAFVVTPLCPHTLSNRPIVDHADHLYTLSLPNQARSEAVAVIDGQIRRQMGQGDVIEIRRAGVCFQRVRLPGYSFYATLHRKLGWAGQPRYRTEAT